MNKGLGATGLPASRVRRPHRRGRRAQPHRRRCRPETCFQGAAPDADHEAEHAHRVNSMQLRPVRDRVVPDECGGPLRGDEHRLRREVAVRRGGPAFLDDCVYDVRCTRAILTGSTSPTSTRRLTRSRPATVPRGPAGQDDLLRGRHPAGHMLRGCGGGKRCVVL